MAAPSYVNASTGATDAAGTTAGAVALTGATNIEDLVGLDTREDVTIVVKNAAGTRLFGIRFDRRGIAIRNLSNQSALIDAEGGTQRVSDYSLAAGTFRFVPFNKIFGEPEP